MLGKLIKYEFKATGRTFLPLYGAILLVTLIHRLFGRNTQGLYEELNKIGDFTTMALVALFIALGVVTLVMIIQRFQKNLLSDEGYLMFTLPVTTRSLILSKIIVAITWTVLSVIVGIISFIILFMTRDFIQLMAVEGVWDDIKLLMQEFKYLFVDPASREVITMMIQVMIAGVIGYIQFILIIYLSLSIAQFPKFQKHRTAASFIAFLAINIGMSWFMGFVGFSIPLDRIVRVDTLMIIVNICSVLIAVGLFELTHYILNRQLNIE